MRLMLTFPGFSSGGKKPAKGKILNKTPKDPAADAQDVFDAANTPKTANRNLYDQHTNRGKTRTQQRTVTDARNTVPDTGGRTNPLSTTSSGSDSWSWGRSKLGSIARALKALTGS